MSSHRAELPLNSAAVRQADDEFYANHHELLEHGQRIPLDPDDPAQARLRHEWMDLYETKNKKPAPVRLRNKKPDDICTFCPADPVGDLAVRVVDQGGAPVEGALVEADRLIKISDVSGYADFGSLPAKEYLVFASKKGYGRIDTYPSKINVPSSRTTVAILGLKWCITSRLTSPKLIAMGSEGLMPPIKSVDIPGSVGGPLKLDFGQDLTFGTGATLVAGEAVGSTESELKEKMSKLLEHFAWDDNDKKAEREYQVFQSKKGAPEIYTDPNLDKAVLLSQNFKNYPSKVLAVPPIVPPAGKVRIHQALAAAGWDINAIKPITDLGVPAFNEGDNPGLFSNSSGDRATGLFTLINSVTHVRVFADQYEFDSCKQEYTIHLVIELYDSFGLDDEDIRKYGYNAQPFARNQYSDAKAITAWWQLQHQFGYAPLITKVVVRPAPFTAPAK